ncbi:MAG: AI-2E family transporter [Saprospirales bacterium]|nr:AI-2E family transporter [Saprospirales bacterium]
MTISANTVIKYFMLLFLVVAGLYFAKEFLIPLAIGAIIATLFLPFCKWLEQKKVPLIVAVFICVLILLLFIAGFLH